MQHCRRNEVIVEAKEASLPIVEGPLGEMPKVGERVVKAASVIPRRTH